MSYEIVSLLPLLSIKQCALIFTKTGREIYDHYQIPKSEACAGSGDLYGHKLRRYMYQIVVFFQ